MCYSMALHDSYLGIITPEDIYNPTSMQDLKVYCYSESYYTMCMQQGLKSVYSMILN